LGQPWGKHALQAAQKAEVENLAHLFAPVWAPSYHCLYPRNFKSSAAVILLLSRKMNLDVHVASDIIRATAELGDFPHHDLNTKVKHARGGFGDGLVDEWSYGGCTFFTDMSTRGSCIGDTLLHLVSRGNGLIGSCDEVGQEWLQTHQVGAVLVELGADPRLSNQTGMVAHQLNELVGSPEDRDSKSKEVESAEVSSHPHPLSLSSNSGMHDHLMLWTCDICNSGIHSTFGGRRYRCIAGCDYDVCGICFDKLNIDNIG